MSCFIVEENSIRSIFRTLSTFDYSGNGGKYALWSTCYNKPIEWFEYFSRKMYVVNHKSFRDRYRTNKSGFSKFKPLFLLKGKILSPFQLLKSMECLAYQCDECPTDYKAIDDFKQIIDELRKAIVQNLPEYKNAEWN